MMVRRITASLLPLETQEALVAFLSIIVISGDAGKSRHQMTLFTCHSTQLLQEVGDGDGWAEASNRAPASSRFMHSQL